MYLLPKNEKSKNGKDKNFIKGLGASMLVIHVVGSKILLKQSSVKGSMIFLILVAKNPCKN